MSKEVDLERRERERERKSVCVRVEGWEKSR
jgi:hypothetical protein